jgi:type I restriction enzyme, S subunit
MFGESETNSANHIFKESVDEMFIGPFGSSLKNECFIDEEKAYCMVYEQKHAIQKTLDLENRYVDERKYNELKRFTVRGGDIIVSCRGTIGETYILPENAPIGIMHPSIMKIRLKPDAYNVVFFNELLTRFFEKNTSADGSSVKMAITAKNLGLLQLLKPPIDLQHRFAAFVRAADKSKFVALKSLKFANYCANNIFLNSMKGGLPHVQ